MIRHFNYTRRKRIKRRHVSIDLTHRDDDLLCSCRLELGTYEFPDDAEVFVEAYRSRELVRCSLGSAVPTVIGDELRLTDLGDEVGVRFNVKVVSGGSDRHLIGLARRIEPGQGDGDSMRKPLLPVRRAPMEGTLWRVVPDFDTGPWLEISSEINDWRSFAREDFFIALAFPAAVRQVLVRLLVIEMYEADGDDEAGARRQWMRFMRSVPGVGPFEDGWDEEERLAWVDEAVSAFSVDIDVPGRMADRLIGEEQ